MIQISKAEARMVRKYLPNLHMKRTVNKYYAEEHPQLLKLLGYATHKDVKAAC